MGNEYHRNLTGAHLHNPKAHVSTHESGGSDALAHNSLGTVQGGTTNEYYHFTFAQHTELNAWLDDVTLSNGGSVDLGSGNLTTTGDIEGIIDGGSA